MFRLMIAVSALALVSACGDGDGQPFDFGDETEEPAADDPTGTGGTGTGGDDTADQPDGVAGAELPPGTTEPQADGSIRRFEPRNEQGGGRIISPVVYDRENDTFTVDNLAFDGFNTYQRGRAIGSMGGYAVYEADVQVTDFLDGDQVGQIVPYRAILGVSQNTVRNDAGETVPRSSFAIVRTGGYVNFGFGGFVYEREGGVVLPTEGQANFSGDYAGIRVFDARGGLEFVRGDMTVDIDFNDFNANAGVKGRIANREFFNADGTPIATGNQEGQLPNPDVVFVITDGEGSSVDRNGEITGQVLSTYVPDGANAPEEYETGTYFAVISGDLTDRADGGEITGVMVITSTDPRDDVPAQETGGFILYR
ncbi:hypothetical protein [Histidinibacterium lentulum]|uniref:Uncharacterized protein n=1 Tax=Histidinibacterium lentulum TaxID=2480588 RepID=A0A3N2QY24_9RHOB|nr:hypothetical protein [Histidinibacterium lentulum]ROU00125.1 hypothetical protein EAT49_12510 [Histidinibacterium lentulum]